MVPEEETVQNVQLCSGGEECVQACVCLFVRDVADRTTKRLVKISSRNEWKHPHLAIGRRGDIRTKKHHFRGFFT